MKWGPVSTAGRSTSCPLRQPRWWAVFVRTEAARDAALAAQLEDPAVLAQREAAGMSDGRADARTGIVWGGNYRPAPARRSHPPADGTRHSVR